MRAPDFVVESSDIGRARHIENAWSRATLVGNKLSNKVARNPANTEINSVPLGQ